MSLLNPNSASPLTFVPYESHRGPTPAASVFAAALNKSGRDAVFNLGQGAEKQTPTELFIQAEADYLLNSTGIHTVLNLIHSTRTLSLINAGHSFTTIEDAMQKVVRDIRKIQGGQDLQSPAYNPSLSGGAENEITAANFLNHMFGHNPTPSSTFVLNQQGRFGLGQAAILINQYGDKNSANNVMVPSARWPMLDGIFGRQHKFELTNYGVQENDLAGALETPDQFERVVYLNSPLNPTGRQTTAEEFSKILSTLESCNSNLPIEDKIFLVIDDPYFHACDQRDADEEGSRFKTFIEGKLNSELHTPWIHILSGSKALATAEKGFSIMSCHDSIAADMRKQLGENGGLAYSRYEMAVMMNALSPKFYDTFLGHCASIREKYFTNFQSLTNYFNERVVKGDPSMTAVVAVDFDEIKDAKIDGLMGTWHIANQNDFIEYLGNEHGTVVVDNGVDANGKWLMRFAFAEQPELCGEGIKRTHTAWDTAKAAPKSALG